MEVLNKELVDEMFLDPTIESDEGSTLKEGFKVTDDDTAGWAMKRLAEVRAEKARHERIAENERKRIDEWLARQNDSLANSECYFEHLLTDYYAAQKAQNAKFKLDLPWGKVTSRKPPKKAVYDEEKCLAWLQKNDADLVKEKVTVSIDKTNLKKKYNVTDEGILVTDAGEIVDGVHFEDVPTTYKVEVF